MPFNPYMFNPRGFDPNQNYGISNPVPQMRARSIFDQPTSPEENTKRFLSQVNPPARADFSQPPEPEQDEGSKYYDELMKTRKTGPALSAYQSALKDQPTYENTPVSTGRKIMGTLAGLAGGLSGGAGAGIGAANEIIESPYKKAVTDYTAKMRNLGESAKLEQDEAQTQAQAIKAAREFGLKHSEFKQKQEEDLFERGIKKGNLAVAERGAASGERRATTGEANAETARKTMLNQGSANALAAADREARTKILQKEADIKGAAQKDTAAYHTATTEWRNKNGKKVTPSQQQFALDLTLREMGMDPQYKDWVHQTDKGFWEVNSDKVDEKSSAYQEFKRRVQKKFQSSLDKGTPFDDEDESDIDITLKPGGR